MVRPLRRRQVIAGRYELQEELGRGGMGQVWLGFDQELDRPVAVKFQDQDRQAGEARFEREAHAAAALSHPNIVRIYDYGAAEGRPFIVLEHIAGGTLADRLASGKALPDCDAEHIARDVAAALAHAHAHGIVHRDLKPSNILLDAEGRAKLGDFGIARSGEQSTLTEAGTMLGTAAYMSPEQATGEAPVGPPADVYAFGVIVFQMLTGRPPFEGDSALEIALKHRTAKPPPVETYRGDAPVRLAALASRALSKEPAGRPPDGTALLKALDGLAEDESPTETLLPPAQAVTPTRRPGRRQAFAAIAALAAAGFAAAWLAVRPGESAPSPSPVGATSGSRSVSTAEIASTPAGGAGSGPTASSTEPRSATTLGENGTTSPTTTAPTTSTRSTTTGIVTTTVEGATSTTTQP
jgi:eukaryotic-like serine/threonine-protein kinase